jgi:hypothetical protein
MPFTGLGIAKPTAAWSLTHEPVCDQASICNDQAERHRAGEKTMGICVERLILKWSGHSEGKNHSGYDKGQI